MSKRAVVWRRLGGAVVVWCALAGAAASAAEDPRASEAPAAAEATPASPASAPAAPAVVPEAVTLGEEAIVGEIVVKGRRGTRTESLEAREVRERGARDLGEALSSLPSIDKVRKGGVANDLVLRGMKRDDVAVTIDGAKVHGACTSRMDPPAFHLDWAEVDVVQVKRGPFDVTQSGGLAGAVDVRTRQGRPGLGTELHLEGGSAGTFASSVTGSFGTEDVDVLVGGAYKEGSPYVTGDGRNFTEVIPASSTARFRDTRDGQQAYRIGSGFARVGVAPADGQRVEVGYTRQSAPRALYPYLKMDGILDDTDRVTARWTAKELGPVAATVQGYWSRVAHDMTDVWRCSSAANPAACTGARARDYSMGTFARSEVWGGQAEVRGGDLASSVAWKGGADFYVRGWDNTTERAQMGGTYSVENSIPDVRITGAGLYAEGRRALGEGGRTRVTAGGRIDLAHSEARTDRSDLYRIFYVPDRLALSQDDVLVGGNVQVERDLGASLVAWVGLGHAARVPDPQERYIAGTRMMAGAPDWVGNPALAPTQSDELDAGVTWRARGLVVKAQAFHAWYANYVNLTQLSVVTGAGTRTARTYENVSARTFGGEATGRVALPARLSVAAGVSYTRGVNDTDHRSLAEIPPLKGTLALRWDDGVFFVEAAEAYAARQGFVDTALNEQTTPAWWTTSLKAGAGLRGVKVYAMVQNLFDRAYVEHLSFQRDPFALGTKVPEPGRAFLLAAQYAR